MQLATQQDAALVAAMARQAHDDADLIDGAVLTERGKEQDRTMITTLIAMTAAWVLLLATLAQPRRPLLDYLVAATLLFAGCLGAAIYLGVM